MISTRHLVIVCLLWIGSEVRSADKNVHLVPAAIPADLSIDVTAQLNEFIDSVPDGGVVRFAEGARFRIDGTVLLNEKRDLVIDGNGALLRAFDPGEDHGKQVNYQGWRQTRNRAHIRISGGENFVVRNLEVHGAHPNAGKQGTYDANREAQHGFDLVQVKNCTLENVTVHDVFGDCVYITKVDGVIVRDSKLTRCGRQGIAIATGENVLIENNVIDDSRRGIIDIEPYGQEWHTTNISIIGNQLGGSRLLLLPMGGGGSIGTLFIADNVNTAHNGTPAIANRGKPDQHRGPFMMVNNRFSIGGSPAEGIQVQQNDGIFIAGNRLTFPENRHMTALDLKGSRGVVSGNVFAGATKVCDTSPDIEQFNNFTRKESEVSKTEWKRIDGGFAVRVTSKSDEFVALMRGGLGEATQSLEGYGQTTQADFAWFQLRDQRIVNHGQRDLEGKRVEFDVSPP